MRDAISSAARARAEKIVEERQRAQERANFVHSYNICPDCARDLKETTSPCSQYRWKCPQCKTVFTPALLIERNDE